MFGRTAFAVGVFSVSLAGTWALQLIVRKKHFYTVFAATIPGAVNSAPGWLFVADKW